jgi:CRP-like cAMP-binding protein
MPDSGSNAKESQLENDHPCHECPLRKGAAFLRNSDEEIAFIQHFKTRSMAFEPGTSIIAEGSASVHLYTLYSGWAFRFKTLSDGRRQILNILLPGDLIGLQEKLEEVALHGVETLSPVLLCRFDRNGLWELYRNHPGLAYDITWLASREERMLDENLLSIGRRTALERAAYLIAFIASRAAVVGLNGKAHVQIPITQQHVADTLGLSLVHTNKTIRKLIDRKLIAWRDGGCEVVDREGLKDLAHWEGLGEGRRPLI